MTLIFPPNSRRNNLVAYASVAVALLLVVMLGVWGAYRDVAQVRSTLLRSAIFRLRAQAHRRVGHIEEGLFGSHPASEQVWWDDTWVKRYWEGVRRFQEHQIYAAIVEPSGMIVLHSEPTLVGERLPRRWYDRVVSEIDDNVVEIEESLLSGGSHVFDVRIPILSGGREIAAYHEGLDAGRLEEQVAIHRRRIIQRWTVVIAGISAVVVVATVSLMRMACHSSMQRQLLESAHGRRISELGQLAAGLAHEIRNPLHALRLNIHALGKAYRGQSKASVEDIESMIQESNLEIDRVDRLIQELLGFTAPEGAERKVVDLKQEIQATANFVGEEMRQKNVELKLHLPQQPAHVEADSNRLRQVFLNLLMNAKDAVGQGGHIDVSLSKRENQVELDVADDGPGIPEDKRQEIFAPFYSTKKNGTGFGLAFVKRYVEDAGGSVQCEAAEPTGTRFRIQLPAARRAKKRR